MHVMVHQAVEGNMAQSAEKCTRNHSALGQSFGLHQPRLFVVNDFLVPSMLQEVANAWRNQHHKAGDDQRTQNGV